MDFALIPFALRKTDRRIVDVDEVQQGLACNCICPSCQTPLVAKKGEVKAWHFAHATRADEGETSSDCDFSWAVSVRLMMRQLLREGLALELPELLDAIDIPSFRGHATQHIYEVVPPQLLLLPLGDADVRFGDTLVDVLAVTNDGPFAVYISHTGRLVPDALRTPPATCAGVLAISLDSVVFEEDPRTTRQSYRQALQDFLTSNTRSKSWVFHPHQAKRRQVELERLQAQRTVPSPGRSVSLPFQESTKAIPAFPPTAAVQSVRPPIPGDPLKYHCVRCEFRWGDQTADMSRCPQCDSRLMITRLRS